MGKKYLSKEQKIANCLSQYKVTCKCGHVLVITPKKDKVLCNYCGHYVYRNKLIEFKEKLEYARKNNR